MDRYPTTLLRHTGYGPEHYDWLLATDADGPLTTFRIDRPTDRWAGADALPLTPLAPHRRLYLTYQGPVTGDRGVVSRADQGTHQPAIWGPDRIVTTVAWRDLTLIMTLTRESETRWTGRARR